MCDMLVCAVCLFLMIFTWCVGRMCLVTSNVVSDDLYLMSMSGG